MTSKKDLKACIDDLTEEVHELRSALLDRMLEHHPFIALKHIDIPKGARSIAIPYLVTPWDEEGTR